MRRPRVMFGMRFAALATGLVVSGCSGPDDGAPAAVVVDSAGIRILTYDLTERVAPVYRTVGEPDLEIGQLDGPPEYSFSRITDLAVTDDGSIAVVDVASRNIRVYDATGAYVGARGRPGEGPGEFGVAPTIAGVSGDTVFAYDTRNRRVTMLGSAGDLVGEVSLRTEAIGASQNALRLDDGSYLVRSAYRNANAVASESSWRLSVDSIVVLRVDASGSLIDTLRVMDGRLLVSNTQDEGGGRIRAMQAVQPFSASSFVLTEGTRLLFARSDVFELRSAGVDGRPTMAIRVLGFENPIGTEEMRAHNLAALREDFGDPVPPEFLELNRSFIPDGMPAFGRVLLGEVGDFWVSRAQLDTSSGTDWLVFSPDGELRGSVFTPPGLQVFRITSDHVVGVVLDDLEVPFVRRYPLVLPVEDAS